MRRPPGRGGWHGGGAGGRGQGRGRRGPGGEDGGRGGSPERPGDEAPAIAEPVESVADRWRRRWAMLGTAAPVVLAGVSAQASLLVDALIVGRSSHEAVAGVVMGGIAVMLCSVPAAGLSTAAQTLVAKWRGTGLRTDGTLVTTLLLAAVGLGLLSLVLGAAVTYGLLPLMARNDSIAAAARDYAGVRFAGVPLWAVSQVFAAYWVASGRATWALGSVILGQGVDAGTSAYLVLGSPSLGAQGAAIGSVLGDFAAVVAQCTLAGVLARAGEFRLARPDFAALAEARTTMIALSSRRAIRPLQRLAMMGIMALMGPAALIAGTMLIRFNMIVGAAVSGFGRAAAMAVAEKLAAGKEADGRRALDDSVVLALVLFSAIGAVVALFPGQVLGAFFDDPGVIEAGRDAVRIFGASAPVLAIRGVLGGAMTALGSTSSVGWRGLARRFGSILPLAWLLGAVAGFGLVAVAAIEAVEAVVGAGLAWRASRQAAWTRKAAQDSDSLAGIDDA